jgi:hypothetical protein
MFSCQKWTLRVQHSEEAHVASKNTIEKDTHAHTNLHLLNQG